MPIGPRLQGGNFNSKDVTFDPGENDAFYGSTPVSGERVFYSPTKNSYVQEAPSVAGDSNNRGYDADALAASIGMTKDQIKATGSSVEDYVAQFNQQIDEAFNPSMDYLNKAQKNIESQRPGIESDINAQISTGAKSLATEKAASERQLAEQGTAAGTRKEDALAAARRLYNELLTGGQQRYGGATSAGEAYKALGSKEFQRNAGDIRSQYEGFVQQLESARQSIQERYSVAVQELENQRVSLLNQARRDFQDKLLQIDQLKAELGTNKANMKLQALQELRNQVYQSNLSADQTKAQVDLALQNANLALQEQYKAFQSGVSGVNQSGQSFRQNTTTAPKTGNIIGSAGQGPMSMVGSISPRREDLPNFTPYR